MSGESYKMGYIFNESVIKGGTPCYKLGYIGYKMGYFMGHSYKSRYKTVFCYKIGYIMLQKGVFIFYKIRYIGYKIGYNLGHGLLVSVRVRGSQEQRLD